MSTERKPRADSRLKTLPEERQAAIVALLSSKSLADVRTELRRDGIETSPAALSEFLSWYQVKEALRRRESRVAGILEQLHTETPNLDEDRLFALGQSVFGAMAIAEEDSKTWHRTQRIFMDRQKLALDRERFEVETCNAFLRWYEDERARQIAEGKGANADKIAALRQLMFAELDGAETKEAA